MNLSDYKKLVKKPKKPKYNNTKVKGFDSRKEAQRAATLQLMQNAGIISDLQYQVKFELIPSQYKEWTEQGKRKVLHKRKLLEQSVYYLADFVYIRGGVMIVEDSKGMPKRTADYIIKRKLMLHVHGIEILET